MIVKKLSQSVARDNSARVNALFRRNSVFRDLRLTLFDQGHQGLFFVPKPILESEQTLYQGSDGTTLTDAHGDPVGLGLEWSKGLVLGPESVTNGAFDTDTDWTKGSGWSISGGVAAHSPGSSGALKAESFSGVSGRYYKITFDLTVSAGLLNVTALGYTTPNISSSGSYSYIFQASTNAGLEPFAASTFDGAIDNISVRELPGHHLTQSVSADRPTYQTDGSLHWLAGDGAGDHLAFSPLATSGPLMVSIACKFSDPTGPDMIIGESIDSALGIKIGVNASQYFVRLVDGAASIAEGAADTDSHVITVTRDGSDTVSLYVDGVFVASNTQAGSCVFDRLLSARTAGAPQAFFGDAYGAILVHGSAAFAERGQVENYLAKLAGITL